ncbi:hypothetical protein SPO2564 [Ruegeria pomeroyi DSS-3]|uniref:Uncharacterized protein n=1 Tax=Ruegeria pomeroyi (strain ATCC 700808 / DSM 15171 / DSS-3) TaxID=246200 RepID=Q5LQC8_RUEPO|nr:hypothetical protein SPO2564 [Ruegeria pomeroyi DSS-3]
MTDPLPCCDAARRNLFSLQLQDLDKAERPMSGRF